MESGVIAAAIAFNKKRSGRQDRDGLCRRPQKGVSAPIAAGHPNYPTEILKRPASALQAPPGGDLDLPQRSPLPNGIEVDEGGKSAVDYRFERGNRSV
jgi:hypothetical protein